MKKASILASVLTLAIVMSCVTMAFAATTPYVESDTTISFTRVQNETYQVKFTVHGTHDNPQIAAGNGSVLQTQNVVKTKDSSGNDVYYFKVKAIGNPATTSAIYTTLPGQAAVRHFVITVIKIYPAGMYRVGSEIPAGEYALISDADSSSNFKITTDSTGTYESIVSFEYFYGRSIVTISDGQYLNVSNAKIYKIDEAPAINKYAKEFPEGMYRVGIDIPAGEFTVAPIDAVGGYYEITSDSSHQFSSIIGNGLVDNSQYLTIENGQYLMLSGAKLIVN